MFAAFAGLAFKTEHDVTLRPGETFETTEPFGHQWRFVSQGVSRFEVLNFQDVASAIAVTLDGKPAGIITSDKRQHVDSRGMPSFDPSTEVGIRTDFRQDVYVVLAGVSGEETAELRIAFNP